MYNFNFKSMIWTIVGIVVFIAIIRFVGFILPYVLVGALLVFLYYKAKKLFKKQSKKENNETYNSSYNASNNTYETNDTKEDYTGKVIDVDYKEVDK